jgi:ParB-like chromosome segregation protein Spo0J
MSFYNQCYINPSEELSTMAKLLTEAFENQTISLDKLISLRDAKIAGQEADLAQRKTKPTRVEELSLSIPEAWDPILITATEAGYVVIDGYHRWEAMKKLKIKEIRATCKPFDSEADIIEAVFEANVTHGSPLDSLSRSNYAYILYKHHPKMKQEDIAKRCHITQAAVSKAINRQLKKTVGDSEREPMKQTLHTLENSAKKLLDYFDEMDEQTQHTTIIELIESVEERERLLNFMHKLENILQPPKRRGPRK